MNIEQKNSVALVDPIVRRFNELNVSITACIVPVAIAYNTLQKVRPYLREMQRLLSQRPKGAGDHARYRMLDRVRGRIVGAAFVTRPEELPTWSRWLGEYAREIGYSARHLQRLIFDEPPKKYLKACRWSKSDHERLQVVGGLTRELLRVIKSHHISVDPRLEAELHNLLDGSDALIDEDWQVKIPMRKRRAHNVTEEGL